MSAEIIKVFKERIPNVRFIGKCYTENDRQNGSFGHKWGEWFANGYFDVLEKLGKVANVDFGYLGFMRCNGNDMENTFEYWIGIFLPENISVPHGFSHIDLQASNVGVCYIKGREDDGLYGMHEQCIEKLSQNGMNKLFSDDKNRAYFFERYNCPRFTTPDENGNVILDYCVYLER